MATVKELKATARPAGGKGAARAERRAGRVPGVIYGNNQPPVTISVDDSELRQRILAGRFLTTIYDIDLEGKKHRVIPRDFHLDPVRDFPLHVDFMRLGEGATIRVSVPLHIQNAEAAPGVKRGGTVNIVTHTIDLECSVDNIPQYVEADVSSLEISHSLHLSDIKLPAGVKSLSREDVTLVTIVPPSGYAEELKAAAAAAAAGRRLRAAAPGALLRRLALRLRPRLVRLPRRVRRRLRPAPRRLPAAATRRSNRTRDAASCDFLLVSAIPARNTRITGTTSVSWSSMKLRGVMVSHHGAAVFRARPRKARSIANASSLLKSADLHERVRAARFRRLRISSSSRPARSPCFRTNSNCRRPRCASRSAAALPATTACVRSPRISATTIAGCGSGSAIPASRNWCTATCCPISPRATVPGSRRCCEAIADNAGLLATEKDSTFQNRVHLALQAKGFFDKDDGDE